MIRIKIIPRGVTAKDCALTPSQGNSLSLSLSHSHCAIRCVSACSYASSPLRIVEAGRLRISKGIILAGLRVVCRLGGGNRRRRVKIKVMEWWHKIVFPVRRAWCAVFRTRKNGAGLLKLHNDIQTCGYEDVQIMWEMLKKTESEVMSNHSKRKQRWFLRNVSWSNHGPAARTFSTEQTQ